MTEYEARSVARIACGADGGCSDCSWNLVKDLCVRFPEHAETFKGVFEEEFS